MPSGTILSNDERRAILRLKQEGKKTSEISKTLNRSRRVVQKYLKNPSQYGILRRPGGRKNCLDEGDIPDTINKPGVPPTSFRKLAANASKHASSTAVWRILQKARHISQAKSREENKTSQLQRRGKPNANRRRIRPRGVLPTQYERERMIYKNKPRKILNLEERVQAIRLYDKNPVYQRVATVFHCSWEQIKNIVSNRDSILAYYARCQIISESDGPRQVRNKKINFLGNVMYEYIKRAVYHNSAPLSDETLIEKAAEFRDILEIENFYPSQVWVQDFKSVYNIDYENNDNILLGEAPPTSLKCGDIISYCTNEVESALKGVKDGGKLQHGSIDQYYEPTDYEENENFGVVGHDSQDDGDFMSNDFLQCEISEQMGDENDDSAINGGNGYSIDNDDNAVGMDYESSSDKGGQLSDDKQESNSSNSNKIPKIIIKKKPSRVTNYRAAVEAISSLEDFAVEKEDFRAINLLSQLTEFYHKKLQKQLKNKK